MRALHLLAVAATFIATSAQADLLRVTVTGHYEYTGAAPSPTSDFILSFTVDRNPPVCGGGLGTSLACGVSNPVYDNGLLHTVLGAPSLLLRDAARKGGFELYQSDVALNRLGFTIGAPQLWTGTLAAPTLHTGFLTSAPDIRARFTPMQKGNYAATARKALPPAIISTIPFRTR